MNTRKQHTNILRRYDMYFDEGQYCKRCKKLFYQDYINGGFSEICPKCKEYFRKHPDKYNIFIGEYNKCKNCGEVKHYMEFTNSYDVCDDCAEEFIKHPIKEKWFLFKRSFINIGITGLNKVGLVLFWIIFIAVCLTIAYFWIGAIIGNFVGIDDSFLNEPRMKP